MHDIWNPWHGCHKCSPGCQNCYMYCLDEKRGIYDSDIVKRTGNFNYPLQKNRQKEYKIKSGERIRVNMTSDTFIEEADAWRDEMWSIVKERSDVIFWFITKRPERIMNHLPVDWNGGYENVMICVTCENQPMFNERWEIFKTIPAKHKGLCLAPLIGPMDIEPALNSGQIAVVECGGENYNNPRPCYYEWVSHIANECALHRINFNFYETGTNFVYQGQNYYFPKKADQAFYAYVLNLNQMYYPLKFDLRMPDGSPAPAYVKSYNKYHCAFCAGRMLCNGCSNCGNCGETEMISLDELLLYEKTTLPSLIH